jgi:hypothetical protein
MRPRTSKTAKTGKDDKKPERPRDPNEALTIQDFCRLERISRRFFYDLEQRGLAPATYKLGTNRRITPEAHQQWRAERQAESRSSVAAA